MIGSTLNDKNSFHAHLNTVTVLVDIRSFQDTVEIILENVSHTLYRKYIVKYYLPASLHF